MALEVDSREFMAALHDALEEVDEIAIDVARDVAATAKDIMRRTVPVKSGKTRDSINYRTGKDSEGRYVEFGPRRFTARFIEYGTSKQPPRPFVRPAIEQAVSQVFGS